MSEEEAIAQDAKAAGLSPEQIAWQQDVSLATSKLKSDHPEDFSYATLDSASGIAEVGFAGAIPGAAAEVAKTVPGLAVHGDIGYSELGLNEDVSAILRITEEQASALGNGYASADVKTQVITVAFDRANTDKASAADAQRVVQQIQTEVTGLKREAPMFQVVVTSSTAPVVGTEVFDGGWLLQVGGQPHCTMSFPIAKNGSSAAGLLTAGHCEGMGTYGGVANAFNPPMNGSLQTTDVIPGGDMRWNWSTVALTGATFVGSGTRRFSSSAYPTVGSSVCKYGWATQYGCTTVVSLNNYYYVHPGGYPNLNLRVGPLAGVSGHITAGGDSGGPWFMGTTGLGVHSGFIGSSSLFTQLPYALQRLDVRLLY